MIERSAQQLRQNVCEGKNTYGQLKFVMARSPKEVVFEALYGIFRDAPESSYREQQVAGRLLLDLLPPCPLPLVDCIAGVLSTWNLSVEELPWYLAKCFGADAVEDALKQLEMRPALSDRETRSIETFRFWLRSVKSSRTGP